MRENNKLLSVHFLRFVAALGVVVHHILSPYNYPVSVGAAGVDIFFVISGIVIGMAMTREGAGEFTLKRVIRVMPLYWVATIAYTMVSHLTWGNSPDHQMVVRSIALWPVFGTEWHPIYFPAWTLEYEMFFYFVATLCIIALREHARSACLIIMLALSVTPVPVPFSAHGYHFASDLCIEFCAGIVISLLIGSRIAISCSIGLGLIFGALIILAVNHQANSVPRPLSWGVPAAMLVLGCLSLEGMPWLSSKLVEIGGDASYSLYLTHITVLDGLSYITTRLHLNIAKHPPIALIILVPACVGFSILFNRYVEKPMLRFLRLHLLPKKRSAIRAA